jgi:hypothetical protein
MADYICEKIRSTGKERSFALVVLDGALRASFPYIEAQMPWLTTMWCSCHILSLFFKDCFSDANAVPELRDALAKAKTVVHFIRDRQKPLAIYTAPMPRRK